MDSKKNSIVDFGLSKMSEGYKRDFFYQLDTQLKMIHQQGGIVRDFSPYSIFLDDETRTPSFRVIYPASKYFSDDTDRKFAQIDDIRMLATLTFGVYLSGIQEEYNIENGLFQFEVLRNNLDFTKQYFPEEDWEYYKRVFEEDLVEPIYYSDFVNRKISDSNKVSSNNRSLVKSTEAGKAMAQTDSESAYVDHILTFLIVGVLTALMIFGYIYLTKFL